MVPPRGWMWVSLSLTLVVGISLGVIGDHLLGDVPPRQDRPRPVWFRCDDNVVNLEDHPDYPYHERLRVWVLNQLSKDLDLEPQQRSDIELLLESKRQGVSDFWAETRSAYCGWQTQLRAEIRQILSPEQQAAWDEILARGAAHRARRDDASRREDAR